MHRCVYPIYMTNDGKGLGQFRTYNAAFLCLSSIVDSYNDYKTVVDK